MRIAITQFVTLDGVSQAEPGTRRPGSTAGLSLVEHAVTATGLLLAEYETTGPAPVAEYAGVAALV